MARMRELEFRAWWKDTKRFLDCDEWYMTCSGAKYLHYAVMPYKDDNFIIEQYTGLKDKNGTKIFEGDIVNMLNITDYPMQIKWNKKWARFIFYNLVDKTEMNLFTEQCEVIGNIYDNPELIKE